CGLDDAPRLFDRVFSREEQSIAAHRIADEALVGIHGLAALVAAAKLDVASDHRRARCLGLHADRDRHALGPELEADVIRVPVDRFVEKMAWRAPQLDDDLSGGYRQPLP